MNRSALPSVIAVQGILVLMSLGWVTPARADYEPHKYTEPGTGLVLEYNLYVPEGYDPSQKYPLLLFLHAAGQPEDLPRKLSKGWTGSFLDNGDDQRYPSFFLIPVSQTNSSGWGDGRSDAEKFEGRLTIVVLKDLVSSGKYNIDAERLYVTGPSMGGRGTWDMIEKNPGLFAAAVPAASPGLDQPMKVIGENIWAINGENDSTVEQNRETIAAIRAAGGNPIYTELAGHGHDTWRTIYPSDAFMKWVYAQRRGVPWWTVSEVPEVSEPLTPGQVVVDGPSGPSEGTGAGGGGGVGGSEGGAGFGGVAGAVGSPGGSGAGGASAAGSGGDSAAGTSNAGGSGGGSLASGGQASTGGGHQDGAGATPSAFSNEEAGCSYSGAPRSSSSLFLLSLAVASLLKRRVR